MKRLSKKTLRKRANLFASKWQENVRCAPNEEINRLNNQRKEAIRKARIAKARIQRSQK